MNAVRREQASAGQEGRAAGVEPAVLVHLSDIHFSGRDDAAAERNTAVRVELMHDLRQMRDRLGSATAVVVTGDIAFSGAPAQYETARQWLDEVAALVGTDNCQVLVVPGNHDVHWPSIEPSARIARESLRTCPLPRITPILDELMADATRPLLATLQHYNEFALRYRCEVSETGRPWKAAVPLPGGYHLALIGLTTVFNSDRNDREGSLVVGATQTALPREDPAAVRVLLAHHGPEDCRDRVQIRDRIKNRVSALLCGHRHDQRVQTVSGCVEIIAGAVHPEEEPGWDPTYNWLVFDVQPTGQGANELSLAVYPRVMRPEWNEFRSGTGTDAPDTFTYSLPALSPPTSHAVAVTPGASAAAAASAGSGVSGDGVSITGDTGAEAEERPPLLDEEGHVDPVRRLTRDLLDLPVTAQETVLRDCGLLKAEDEGKDHVRMILDVLARVGDDATRTQLVEAIAAHTAQRP